MYEAIGGLREFASWLGKRSYKACLRRFGLERHQEISARTARWASKVQR